MRSPHAAFKDGQATAQGRDIGSVGGHGRYCSCFVPEPIRTTPLGKRVKRDGLGVVPQFEFTWLFQDELSATPTGETQK
jgi:hypothetical protein